MQNVESVIEQGSSDLIVYLENLKEKYLDEISPELYSRVKQPGILITTEYVRMHMACLIEVEAEGIQVKAVFKPKTINRRDSYIVLLEKVIKDEDTKTVLLPLSEFASIAASGDQVLFCNFKDAQLIAGNSAEVFKQMVKAKREILLQPLT